MVKSGHLKIAQVSMVFLILENTYTSTFLHILILSKVMKRYVYFYCSRMSLCLWPQNSHCLMLMLSRPVSIL